MNGLGALVASSIPAQLPGHEPASFLRYRRVEGLLGYRDIARGAMLLSLQRRSGLGRLVEQLHRVSIAAFIGAREQHERNLEAQGLVSCLRVCRQRRVYAAHRGSRGLAAGRTLLCARWLFDEVIRTNQQRLWDLNASRVSDTGVNDQGKLGGWIGRSAGEAPFRIRST